MLDSARDVMEGSALLIHEAKQALISPGDAESQQRLAQVRRSPAWLRMVCSAKAPFDTVSVCVCVRLLVLQAQFSLEQQCIKLTLLNVTAKTILPNLQVVKAKVSSNFANP